MATVCPNCGAALTSKYCGECGQRNTELRLTAAGLARELSESFFKVDGKLWPTIRGLFVPGFLTEEFRRGRRARYHRPIAVFFVAAGLLFSVRSCANLKLSPEAKSQTATGQIAGGMMKIGTGLIGNAPQAEAISKRSEAVVAQTLPLFEFLRSPKGLLIYALITAAIFTFWFRKTRVLFSEHFVYALHVEALSALVDALARATTIPKARTVGTAIAISYGVMALKRVYSLSWVQAVWQSVVLLFLQYAVTSIVAGVIVVPALLYLFRDLLF